MSPSFRYQVSGSDFWYPIITAFAWCPKCKEVRYVESLDFSTIQTRVNQLRLEEETYRLKNPGLLARIKMKYGLSECGQIQHELHAANRLIGLLKTRTDRKCITCGYFAPSEMFESGYKHPSSSCRGGILTEQVEETGLHVSFDNSCREVRWYSAEGVFLRSEKGRR
jgi:hypothetical protein